MIKREIYSIVFNKAPDQSGKYHLFLYDLGVPSANAGRTPKSIVKKDDKITVTFTDESRHIIPYTDGVEIFDRIVEPKQKTDVKQ